MKENVSGCFFSEHSVVAEPVKYLTLWCPMLPYGHSYKASCARQG